MNEILNDRFNQLSAYFDGEKSGNFFVVNVENFDAHHAVLQRLQADDGKRLVFVSDNLSRNGLPDINAAIKKASVEGDHVLVGLSQALMLRGAEVFSNTLHDMLERSVEGRGVVLLFRCASILRDFVMQDRRREHRVLLVEGERSQLPTIRFSKSECLGTHALRGIGEFLQFLERATDAEVARQPITVITSLSSGLFANSMYRLENADAYESLSDELKRAIPRDFGSDDQWQRLIGKISACKNLEELIEKTFGSLSDLQKNLSRMSKLDDDDRWLLQIALKMFDDQSNAYLSLALNNCNDYRDFQKHLYLDLIDVELNDTNFEQLYEGRRQLIGQLRSDSALARQYCDRLGKRQRAVIFYLTDANDSERREFMQCLNDYDYDDDELHRALAKFGNLSLYMRDFVFDCRNAKLSDDDADFAVELTRYFRDYKRQKLLNRLDEEFLSRVWQYACSRPYNKLQSRSNILAHLDLKNASLFFFDALGAEYLAFIADKCSEYDLLAEIYVGRCELPSLTENNKEFLARFDDCRKIDALDNIKHHSQTYDYQKCKLPIHLFAELELIDKELRNIQSKLLNDEIERAVVVSDHGASRLAVLYAHDSDAAIALDDVGSHGGRCCRTDCDPRIERAAYENGWAILADYDRFKGGRRAEVEVHGGASLEEVIVPVIIISKRPRGIEIGLVEDVITLKPHTTPTLTIFSNIPIREPRLCINDNFYDGELPDDKHARFALPNIKRKGKYRAVVFDGSKILSEPLAFTVKRMTREVDLL